LCHTAGSKSFSDANNPNFVRIYQMMNFILIGILLIGSAFAHSLNSLANIQIQNVQLNLDGNITLSASPKILTAPSEWVTVSWSGVREPTDQDWIGVFSPGDIDISRTAPVKYQFTSVSPSYTSGSGSIQFDILNMHADYIFLFFRNGTTFPVAAASSNRITFQNLELPLQGHLSLTGQLDQMRLSFTTGTGNYVQYVLWGTQSGMYTRQVQATSYGYTQDEMCGPPAGSVGWRNPGTLHTAVLTELELDTNYFYKYGSNEAGWSPEYSFKSAPKVDASTGITFVAYGDMGKGQVDGSLEVHLEQNAVATTQNIINFMSQNELDLVLHIGDISYAMGYQSGWDEFMYQVLPITTAVPYMTCGGNHEIDYPDSGSYYNGTDSGGECGVPYERRFPYPNIQFDPSSRNKQHWYSFDYGNVHFVMMSTEHDFQVGSDQYNWLAEDLAAVDREVTPWVILSGHRPMYIDSTGFFPASADQPVAELLRANVEPLLVKYEVDLAFWGHHHSYQRTCPVNNEVCGSNLPIHVVIGMAGHDLSQNLLPQAPVWIEYVDDNEWGYTVIQTTEDSLVMSYYNNNNVLMDQFELK